MTLSAIVHSAKPKQIWLGLAEDSRSAHFRGFFVPILISMVNSRQLWIALYVKQWMIFLPLEYRGLRDKSLIIIFTGGCT